jgi:hypothetical protein
MADQRVVYQSYSYGGLVSLLTFVNKSHNSASNQLGLRKNVRKLHFHISKICLERDSALWSLGKEEIQRRRTIFWEFFTWECWAVGTIH